MKLSPLFLVGLVLPTTLCAAKLTELRVVDQQYLMVTVLDGEVSHKDDGLGVNAFTGANQADADIVTEYLPTLSTAQAQTITNWTIKSTGDVNYSGLGKNPTAVHRKTKLNGHAQLAWGSSDYAYKSTFAHTLYLKLPQPLVDGQSYTVDIAGTTNIDKTSQAITFAIQNQISEAIHVNLVGYHSSSFIKAADLYLWMGDGGARDYTSFVGKKVWLANAVTKAKTEVGTVKAGSTSGEDDVFWRDQTKSPVWHVDFTGASVPTGSYQVVVEGVGASQVFWIADEIYYNPFLVSVRGFFYMRIGQDTVGGMKPVPRRPLFIPGVSPATTTVYLTTMHPYHAEWTTFGSGDKWDLKNEWAKYKKTGNPTNPKATGGHSDAADWDRYLGHVSIIYDMLLPYFLSNGKIGDDNLGIAESGNGIPDIIDEARNEVDFWLNLRDESGYSHGINNPNDAGILYQAAPTGVAAWANAANAAMLADCFRIAGKSALSNQYRDSAIVAWNFATALADPMLDKNQEVGTGVMRGRDFKMTAAAFLYNLTGDVKYETALATESEVKTTSSVILKEDTYNQIWAVAGYLKTPQPIHQQTLWDNMKASVINQAMTEEVANVGQRASRRSTPNGNSMGYWITAHNVHHAIIAHAVSSDVAQKRSIMDALILEADYGLGRNGANMIQMTTSTTPLSEMRSVQGIYTTGRDDGSPGLHPGHTPYMNLDDWACGMVMGCPSKLYASDYPADFANTWPADESYHNSRYVWAHGEFTPQQTMRGKTALYGYLYAIGSSNTGAIKGKTSRALFVPGEFHIRVLNLQGRTIWKGTKLLTQEQDLLQLHIGQSGLFIVQASAPGQRIQRSIMLHTNLH